MSETCSPEFLQLLEALVTECGLNVRRLECARDRLSGDCIDITFCNDYKRRVCIEADSRAAIIRDVLKGCE